MGVASATFEAVPYGIVLLLLCAWTYRFLFNHEIIRNYANRLHTSKAQINIIIDKDANAKFGCNLLHVNVEDELEDRKEPAVSMSKSYSEIHQKHIHRVVGGLFSAVIALSVQLIILLMIQLTGSFDLDLSLFKFSIRTLVVLVTMIQPLLIVSLYVNQDLLPAFASRSPGSLLRTFATVALCVGWYVLLNRFGLLAKSLSEDGQKSFLERKTNEIALTGITITAILSGVGCTLTPFRQFWTEGYKKGSNLGKISETQMNDLIQSYNNTKMLLFKRQRELNSLLVSNGGTVYNQPKSESVRLLRGSGKHLLNKVQSFANLSAFNSPDVEEEELKREIDSLKLLKELIYGDLTKALDRFLREKLRAPSNGHLDRVLHVFNVAFSVYCLYRIVNVVLIRLPYHFFWSQKDFQDAAMNITDDREKSSETLNKNTKDALAITIAKLIQSVSGYLPMSETQLINQVSFILSGSLFVCSFQNVLVTFKSLGRILPGNTTSVSLSVKSWLKNLVVSELLAIYVIATALLIRSNLPPEISNLMLKILSLRGTNSATASATDTEMEFIDELFDKVFGVTCVITLLVVALKVFIESDNVHDDGYDEENMIENGSMFKMS